MFENLAPGTGSSLTEDARLECGICWWVYDPSVGDDTSRIAPGTPFTQLPAEWRCPQCDAPREKFLVLIDEP